MNQTRHMAPAQVTIHNLSPNTTYEALVRTLVLASKDILDVHLLDGESKSQSRTLRSLVHDSGLKTAIVYCKSWNAAMEVCILMQDLHNSAGTPLKLELQTAATSSVGRPTKDPVRNNSRPEGYPREWNGGGEDLDEYEMNKYYTRSFHHTLPSAQSTNYSTKPQQPKPHKLKVQQPQRHQTELQAQIEFLDLTRHMTSFPTPPSSPQDILEGSSSPSSSSVTSSTYATSTSQPSASTTRGCRDHNPPCNTLYIGNLPKYPLEHELRSIFVKQPGQRRFSLTHKPSGPVCFVEFESIPHAANALYDLRGCILSNSVRGPLRLSFARNSFGLRWNIDRCTPFD